MIIKDDAELDLALNFRVDDFEYVVFVTTDKMKCFGCGKSGHLIRSCPDKSAAGGSASTKDKPASEPAEVGLAEAVPTVDIPVGEGATVEGPVEAGSTSVESLNEGRDISSETVAAKTVLLNSDVENMGDVSDIETESRLFKVPTKRKHVEKISHIKCFKKGEVVEGDEDQKESESGSEMSDSSTVLSQSEAAISRSYDVDDIKRFLNTTKNKRGVVVKDYFPDLNQFYNKAKGLLVDGCLSNREVYRLKKIVRKVGTELNENED